MAVAIDTLAFLIGEWSIERVITDHRDRSVISFSGTATVALAVGGATYLERGTVSRGAHTGPARRGLRLAERDDGTVRVDFEDGRPFLNLDLTNGGARATHPCREDTYEMAFEVQSHEQIRETWRVSGPAKDYEAETVWQRL